MYITVTKCGVSSLYNVYERSLLCSSSMHLFDQKYSKTVMLEMWCYNQFFHSFIYSQNILSENYFMGYTLFW